MFTQELGWLVAAFFIFLSIVTLFGLADSICQKKALSTCITDEDEQAREAIDDYLEMMEDVRLDMISNPIGSIVAHMTSWVLTAAVVFCAQDTVGSQYGRATWQIWLTGFFLFLYLLLVFLTFANMVYYGSTNIFGSSDADKIFAKLDKNAGLNQIALYKCTAQLMIPLLCLDNCARVPCLIECLLLCRRQNRYQRVKCIA